jgi:hypothetical protein
VKPQTLQRRVDGRDKPGHDDRRRQPVDDDALDVMDAPRQPDRRPPPARDRHGQACPGHPRPTFRGPSPPPRLPLDRAADRRDLIRGRRAAGGDGAHRFETLAAGVRRRRGGAAFVELAAIFELQVAVEAEEVGRADGAIGASDVLRLVVQ